MNDEIDGVLRRWMYMPTCPVYMLVYVGQDGLDGLGREIAGASDLPISSICWAETWLLFPWAEVRRGAVNVQAESRRAEKACLLDVNGVTMWPGA